MRGLTLETYFFSELHHYLFRKTSRLPRFTANSALRLNCYFITLGNISELENVRDGGNRALLLNTAPEN